MGEVCRVLIADQHVAFRTGLRTLLEALPELLVIGEAAGRAERA